VPRNLLRRGGLVAVVGMLTAVAACGSSSVSPPPPSLGSVVSFAIPNAVAHIPLTEPDGTTTDLAAYQGKTVMIADFLTECTDICPLISANTLALTNALNADGVAGQVALLEISVDPDRDTPARLTAYQQKFGSSLPKNWTLLRATPADTKQLWKYFGIDYGRDKEPKPASTDWLTHKKLTYDVFHSDDLIFLGPNGTQRFIVNADPDVLTGGGRLPPRELVQFLNSEGEKALYKPNPVATWTVAQGLQIFSWLLDQKLAGSA
jgi:cytochrome oxidase Cu insertion factor (SCO1/SenC/PrrC family)